MIRDVIPDCSLEIVAERQRSVKGGKLEMDKAVGYNKRKGDTFAG